ncbi:hypothetical protein Tco_1338989, partial [Tanacetum coccineum]
VIGVDVPTIQPQLIESTQGANRTPRATRTPDPEDVEEDVEKIVEGEDEEFYASEFADYVFLNDEEDSGTRLEPESHKKNPKIVNDDEEEKKDDKKDDDNDNDDHDDHALVRNKVTSSLDVRNEKMQAPIPSPPRSPRTCLSLDKT